jgi:hypothetical protein
MATGREIYAADGTTITGYRGLNNTVGTLYSNNANCFLITVKNTGGTAIDLRAEDDAASEAVEMIVMETNPLAFFVTDSNAGTIMGIFDVSISAANLQHIIRTIGGDWDRDTNVYSVSAVGTNNIDASGTTVTAATSIVFA